MKWKYGVYGFLALSFLFAAAALYLFLFSGGDAGTPLTSNALLSDKAKASSGRGGKLLVAYSGDIEGKLDPCG